MIIVRKAAHADTKELELLFRLIRRSTFTARNIDAFKIGDYNKSTEGDEGWVGEESGVILGFATIYTADNFLHNLFVHPNHQGRGFGSQLLKIAKANLHSPMTAKIAMDNLKVTGFYEKHAWSPASLHLEAPEPYVLYVRSLA